MQEFLQRFKKDLITRTNDTKNKADRNVRSQCAFSDTHEKNIKSGPLYRRTKLLIRNLYNGYGYTKIKFTHSSNFSQG
jgi:hypothetical protein